MFQARQGDVLVTSVKSIPQGATFVKNEGRIVLAYGEVTGHAHALSVADAQEFTMADARGIVRRFLQVLDGGATLRHEEHAPIVMPPGVYEIVQQREYFPDDIRSVAD